MSFRGRAFAGPIGFEVKRKLEEATAEFKETHVVTSTSGETRSSASVWLAFVVGALLIATVAVFFMNAHGSFSGPGGPAEFDIKSPIPSPAAPAK